MDWDFDYRRVVATFRRKRNTGLFGILFEQQFSYFKHIYTLFYSHIFLKITKISFQITLLNTPNMNKERVN